MPTSKLLEQQNPDGGWPYRHGGSWMEPTVYAVLALTVAGDRPAADRGLAWIRTGQRDDGGWQVRPGVGESCWVTSLAALLPGDRLGSKQHQRAVNWLSANTGLESTTLYRVRQWLMGGQASPETKSPGWPWVTGSAAWVSPTSMAILALERENRLHPAPGLESRIEAGRQFLINRMCKGGGWNHGSVRALGYESDAYPETTGMALAALRGCQGREMNQSLDLALRFLNQCHSADALNWLRLGLLVHGRLPVDYCRRENPEPRTLPEASLEVLAANAEKGRGFWC